MKIPFADLGAQHREIKKEINRAIARVIKRGDFILGEDVKLFEEEFSHFCNTRYAVGVSSGTAALFLALLSLDIGAGDEVIVPAFTYIATSLAVSYTGAKPVFVDIEEDSYNIDTLKIKKAITGKTRAIIPVHLYGQPADMRKILDIAKEYNLKVIEDAAQAHGAKVKMQDNSWQITGGIGDIGCFSFYPSKNLGALGDGGIITTNKEGIYKKLLMLRDYGRVSKYEHTLIGYNSRLDTLQAAILRIKLRRLNKWNDSRRASAKVYAKELKGVSGVIPPREVDYGRHIYHVYALRVKNRDVLLRKFAQENISALVHYPIPLHLQKAYADLGYKKGDFPVSEKAAQEVVSLPMYPHLKEAQIKFAAKVIKDTLDK